MRPTNDDLHVAMQAHGTRIERYRQGKLTDDEFRPIRLGYGLYYQLDHTSHMQRIKLPGGLMTADQVDELAAIGDDYARSILHITTRADVQVHWIEMDQLMPMYERLHKVGITTRGACADTVRNVTGCYHAGLLPGEAFDVQPYVYAAHEYFLFHPLNLTLPRKFKIGFASCEYDCIQAPINDIAFHPHVRDGKQGFAVHAGGGLGSQPFLAKPVIDFIPAEDALIVAEAIVRMHHSLGERKNRKRARLKYVFQRLGKEKYLAEVQRLVAQVEQEQGDVLRAELREIVAGFQVAKPNHKAAVLPTPSDPAFAHWARTNAFEQKQKGYYCATVQIPLGDVTSDQFRALAQISRDHGGSEVRASNDQNVAISWIPGDHLEPAYRALCEIGLGVADALHITDVVSCPGADYCSLAISRSMGLAEAIRDHLGAMNGQVEDLGVFRIRISGCPNSCGQHHVGDIGLTGLSIKGDDGEHHPFYSMLVGARVGETDVTIGHRVGGRFPLEQVPSAVAAIAEHYRRSRSKGEKFPDFVTRVGTDQVTEVARIAAPGAR